MKKSIGIVKHVYEVIPFRFVKRRHKTPLIIKKNKSDRSEAQFVPKGNRTIC